MVATGVSARDDGEAKEGMWNGGLKCPDWMFRQVLQHPNSRRQRSVSAQIRYISSCETWAIGRSRWVSVSSRKVRAPEGRSPG